MEIDGFNTLRELFAYACRKDRHAVRFCEDAWRIAHLWDDLIDGDTVTPQEINETMASAYTGMMSNPFVQAHASACSAVLALVVANWHTANSYEAEKTQLEKAYMLRAQLYNVPVLCAFLLGGQEWANHVSLISWNTYGENLDAFIKETNHA